MALFLKNARFIDWINFEFVNSDIKVEEGVNGSIVFLPEHSQLPKGSDFIDCTGKYVIKSFVNCHHHIYSALARGMPAPKKTPASFPEILKYIWWNLDKNLSREMIEISALVTAIECAKNGVTFVIDHHSSPGAIGGSLELIAGALEKVGLSHLLCYEISDRDGEQCTNEALEETANYLHNYPGLVGLHASFTVSNTTFKNAVALADKFDTGIHIHVAEDKYDQIHCRDEYNDSVIERIGRLGGLHNPKTILGHCLHINGIERKIINNSKVWVVQNTESNLNNRVGFFNSAGLGENILLGTDGMHSDMISSAKAAYFTGLNSDKVSPAIVYGRLRNGHRYLSENGFTGDDDNNLVVLDYPSPTDFNRGNFPGHFFYGFDSRYIQHVIAKGKLVVRDRKLTTVDEETILKTSRDLSKKLWEKMKR
jgi:cytosine/adenosine deaminase-related metal-dependent hydrolase